MVGLIGSCGLQPLEDYVFLFSLTLFLLRFYERCSVGKGLFVDCNYQIFPLAAALGKSAHYSDCYKGMFSVSGQELIKLGRLSTQTFLRLASLREGERFFPIELK